MKKINLDEKYYLKEKNEIQRKYLREFPHNITKIFLISWQFEFRS